MPMLRRLAAVPVAILAALSAPLTAQQPGFVQGYLQQAEAALAAADLPAARAAVERALERDDRSLPAWHLLRRVAAAQQDRDAAVHAAHRWLDLWETAGPGRPAAKDRKAFLDALLQDDPEASAWQALQKTFLQGLLDLGKQYRNRKDWLGALDLYGQVLQVSPGHAEASAAIQAIRSSGGREVAIEDVHAGTDPTGGLSEEAIAELDRAHATWDTAHTGETDNYRYRTDAGHLVLRTSMIAMEQMNAFYRRFFRFMEDGGKTPKIEIRIFKSRDEYLSLGQNPQPWSGGHFIGSAVETYTGGVNGKESIRDMYRTLFHEAAHQFVSLTGPMVPGWLNEAYASFFEGCVILSNGSVKWNLAPPGRLFPLAARMEKGWMAPGELPAPGADGQWTDPAEAPRFATVVGGGYQWGPPWYAPTWGVVYFLYNYRHADGRPVYRDALHAYYVSFKRGAARDPVGNFEEIVLRGSPLSPVQTLAELDPIWRDWILRLRDIETGKVQQGDQLLQWAKAALERDERAMALEFLEEARAAAPQDVEVLWLLASTLEQDKQKPQAAARYREVRRVLELLGRTDDPRHQEARKKIVLLDPLVLRLRALTERFGEQGLLLARGYEARELPTMALEIARQMSSSFQVREALDYFTALATRTGKSLARWKVAYNERDLRGWSASGDGAFQAYGALLRAQVEARGDDMVTRELTCDVTFDADYSLSAEMRIEALPEGGDAGRLMGLCFGRKGDGNFHAAILHPKGFLDIASNRGGVWTVHDHRSLPVGNDWHALRVDVAGDSVDVYFDGLYVRSLAFADPAVLRGAFGLLCGPGQATFRNVRILARDPFDPAARIERELAMQRVLADASLRQPGSFSGLLPPDLGRLDWRQGEAVTLAALRGKVVALVFWSPFQDKVIPTTRYLQHLAEKGGEGLVVLAVTDPGTTPAALAAWLADHPMPQVRVAIDDSGATLEAYFVKPGHFGMPRVVLLGPDGKVAFEGDPGLRSGVGWDPADGPTYVDAALDKLLGR